MSYVRKNTNYWSDNEEKEVLKMISEGIGVPDIAIKIHRSANAVQLRLVKIALEYHDKKMPFDEITKLTSISQSVILAEMEKNKYRETTLKKIDLDDIMEVLKEIQTDIKELKNKK